MQAKSFVWDKEEHLEKEKKTGKKEGKKERKRKSMRWMAGTCWPCLKFFYLDFVIPFDIERRGKRNRRSGFLSWIPWLRLSFLECWICSTDFS